MSTLEETDNALFEAVFIRAFDVTGPLEAELRRLGYDRRKAVPRYPSSVFFACIEALRAVQFPEEAPEEGRRKIGHEFACGFQQTIVGRVILGAVQLVGPTRLLNHLPGKVTRMRSGLKCSAKVLAPTHQELHFQESFAMGDFYAGAMEHALGLAGAKEVKIAAMPSPGGYVLDIAW